MNIRDERISADRIAQASAWVATLHGDSRTSDTEHAFQRWLADHPLNARAFEQITELWEVTRSLPRRRIPPSVSASPKRMGFALAAGIVLTVSIGAVLYFWNRGAVISTGIGEQRIVALDDGTQVTLNTDTHLSVSYSETGRHIRLTHGEALFEIAKDASRPFVVSVDENIITALGTSFAVLKDSRGTAVTLIDGKVAVTTRDGSEGVRESGEGEVLLSPGERITLSVDGVSRLRPAGKAVIDHPPLEKVLAWKRREVLMNETPLREAMAEMNRYSRKELIAGEEGLEAITVTGLFRAGDSLSFAHAVADTYRLRVTESGNDIRLDRKEP